MDKAQFHLLVVDDEELNRDLLSRRLIRSGYRVSTASNGREALEQIEVNDYSLVLLDVMMPELNGLSMLRMLRATRSADELPVIMATAMSESDAVVEALALGANDYVTKPIDFAVTLARVEAQLKRCAAMAEARLRERRYSAALESSRATVWDLEVSTERLFLSPEWLNLIGDMDAALQTSLTDWLARIDPAQRLLVKSKILGACQPQAARSFEVEFRIRRADGAARWLRLYAHSLQSDDGATSRLVGSQTDVTAERQSDAATGLPNRNGALEFLSDLCVRNCQSITLISFRLANFESIRGCAGREAADLILASLAAHLLRVSRALLDRSPEATPAFLARSGDDELVAVLDGLDSEASARAIADAITGSLRSALLQDPNTRGLPVHIGYSFSKTQSSNPEAILSNARLATYSGDQTEATGAVAYVPSMRSEVVERIRIDEMLSNCEEERRLVSLYQPIVRAADGGIHGVEALLRLRNEDQGFISPAVFIPVAESSGRIHALGRWILEKTCRDLLWPLPNSAEEPVLRASVNVSVRQLQNKNLAEAVHAILQETGFPPERLSLEITESVFLQDEVANLKVLRDLKALGLRLHLDDFGTGYSSLQALLKLPLDGIKIDRSLVKVTGNDGNAEHIIQSVVSMARRMGCITVAEGVETEAQLNTIRELGCDFIQGYYFHKPLALDQLCEVLIAEKVES